MENGTSTAMPDALNRGYSNSFMDSMIQRAADCHSRPDAVALSQAQLAAMDPGVPA
jgi:hypothetical protein